MASSDKKLAVLHQLSQESEPITLSELLSKLGEDYSSRSIRRWLSEMEKEGMVEKSGNKRSTKYQVMDRSQRLHGSCFGLESEKVIEQIKRPLYERLPTAYVSEWIAAYKPNSTFYIPLYLRQQLHKAGKRSKNDEPAGTYAHQIYHRLLIDLSYNSSRLEGNTYSLLDTQKLLFEGLGAEGKLDQEKIMILNHKEAIRYLVDHAATLTLTKETIFTLHYLLADGLVESQYTGKIRDHGVRIGGSTYLPFENPKRIDQGLDVILEKASLIEDPYEKSLFLLAHLSYLQAFTDVNKRTARLSANIPLIQNNLVPLSFNDVEKEDYTNAVIAIYELQNMQPLLDLYAFSYMRTCALYDSTIKAMGFDEIRVRYRQQRRQLIREIVLNLLTDKNLEIYLSSQIPLLVKEADQQAFREDIMEDLRDLDESRIVGMGLSFDQLHTYLRKRLQR